MTSTKRILALTGGVILSGICTHASVGAADSITAARPGGFITKSARRAPTVVDGDSGGLVDRALRKSIGRFALPLPFGLEERFRIPGPDDKVSAGLRHLRLNIILREMKNVVVSGSGVDSLGAFQEPWSTFKIVSTAADESIPEPGDPEFGLEVPGPGDTWSDIAHANGLFQGIITNGCMGTPATFDLTLDSSVFRVSTGDVFGDVHLVDEVAGHGYYNFKYTIRATDEAGNVSDFVFSGDADSYCTSQATFSN